MGKLSASNQSILDDPAVALRRKLEWFPDSLGNWSGVDEVHNLADKGLTRTDKTPGQSPVVSSILHEVDAFNRIQAVTTNSQPVAHVNDPAGNLVFDGTYVYQYDAWNRLVEVNHAGSLVYDGSATDDFDADGKIHPNTNNNPVHEIGDLVVRFQYDGLGRLMLAQKPVSGSPPDPTYKTEHYYYDGVRRVQEVIQTPGDPEDSFETAHEYVYGPGYVDEFVLESQKSGGAQQDFYVLQDANFNVMALTNASGGVVEQYQWEPYGLLAAKDTDTGGTIPHSHIGHQGLFFYRFNPQTGDTATLSTTAIGLYFNRNRWYSPHLGRFMTRDPRGTSMPGFAQPCPQSAFGAGCDCEMPKIEECQGCGCGGCDDCCDSGIIEPCSAGSCFEDGMNLHEYVQSNPVLNKDPAGTFVLVATLAAASTSRTADFEKARSDVIRGIGITALLTYLVYRLEQVVSDAITDITYDADRSRRKGLCFCFDMGSPDNPSWGNHYRYGTCTTTYECNRTCRLKGYIYGICSSR